MFKIQVLEIKERTSLSSNPAGRPNSHSRIVSWAVASSNQSFPCSLPSLPEDVTLAQARCKRHELGWLPRSQRLSPWHLLSCLCTKCFWGRNIWPKPGKSDSPHQDTATSVENCRQGCLCIHCLSGIPGDPLSWSPSNCLGPLFFFIKS